VVWVGGEPERLSSFGRVLTPMEIFSEHIRLQTGSSASSWGWSSCCAVEQRVTDPDGGRRRDVDRLSA